MVRVEGLEPTHLTALDPKSSVSTSSTTPAIRVKHLNSSFDHRASAQTIKARFPRITATFGEVDGERQARNIYGVSDGV